MNMGEYCPSQYIIALDNIHQYACNNPIISLFMEFYLKRGRNLYLTWKQTYYVKARFYSLQSFIFMWFMSSHSRIINICTIYETKINSENYVSIIVKYMLVILLTKLMSGIAGTVFS